MKKVNQIWALIVCWISKKIRSPFSNYATKFVLLLGSGIVAAPVLEHLIVNAVLKHGFGIDLGIKIPDVEAYIAGGSLVAISLIHNLVFLKLNNDYQIKVKDVEVSIYQALWERLDTVVDDTSRLSNLYFTYYSDQDEELTVKAEESIMQCADFLRKNRPFFFSEDLYKKCMSIINSSYDEVKAFRACINVKLNEEGSIGKNASFIEKMEHNKENYDYHLACKEAKRVLGVIKNAYNDVCEEIRAHIGTI